MAATATTTKQHTFIEGESFFLPAEDDPPSQSPVIPPGNVDERVGIIGSFGTGLWNVTEGIYELTDAAATGIKNTPDRFFGWGARREESAPSRLQERFSNFRPKFLSTSEDVERSELGVTGGIVSGLKVFGGGMYDGVTGLVAESAKGLNDGTPLSITRGLAKGSFELLCKPLAGSIEAVSLSARGATHSSVNLAKGFSSRLRGTLELFDELEENEKERYLLELEKARQEEAAKSAAGAMDPAATEINKPGESRSPRESIDRASIDEAYLTPPLSPSRSHSPHSPPLSPSSGKVGTCRALGREVFKTPKMEGSSSLLSELDVRRLAVAMPPRYHMGKWTLEYSMKRDGVSLHTLLRKAVNKAPTLLVFKDRGGGIFGCYAAERWRNSAAYYGNGETFVFQLSARAAKEGVDVTGESGSDGHYWRWSRKNSYFQHSSVNSDGQKYIAVGGGGHFALLIDEELGSGSSGECETFDSPCLATTDQWRCQHCELWSIA